MPDVPPITRLGELSNEALTELHAGLTTMFNDRTSQELTVASVAEVAELSAAIDAVTDEMNKRDRSRESLKSEVAELMANVASKAPATTDLGETALLDKADEKTEPEAKADDAKAEDDTEATKAEDDDKAKADTTDEAKADTEEAPEAEKKDEAAVTAGALSPAGLESKDLAKAQDSTPQAVIVASADIPGVPVGKEMESWREVADAFISRRLGFRGVSPQGDGDQVIVASIKGNYPEERQLDPADFSTNMNKVEAVASPTAITASGGLCAPLEPYYGIQVISEAMRPVRDSLPKFQATRGGVRWIGPPRLSDLTSAIGVTTATQDAATYGTGGGETPFKPCLHVTCEDEHSVTISAIHRCLTFGNFGARTYPEQVEAWLSLSLSSHARRAETLLLDAIAASSTAVTAAATYSAVRSLLPQVDQAVAAYRSRHRTGDNIALRVMLPAWTKELIRSDMARGFFDDVDALNITDAQITGWFTARNVNVTWYVDTATGAGQVFGAQSAGALLAFPSTVQWFLFVEGSFVFLDGGTLDLGLVRDSTLNKTNDYQIFAETFEAVAFYGIESLKITSTVCPNGVRSPAASASAPC